jgi:hypothetical protein
MLKLIIEDFKEYKALIKEWFFYRRHALKLKLAIRLADIKQAAFNKQFFVILSPTDKLVAINNTDVRMLKKMKLMSRSIDGMELRRKSFYYTLGSANNKMSTEELQAAKERYFRYAKKYLK